MLRSSLDYPTRPPHGGRVVLLAGLLIIVTWLLVGISTIAVELLPLALVGAILWLVVRGYYVHVLRTVVGRPRPTPPPYGGYGRLLVDGIQSMAILVVYLAPGILVLAGVAGLTWLDVGADLESVPRTVAGLLSLAGLAYLAGALYVVPIAVTRFAYESRLGAAFEGWAIFEAAFSEDYALAWIVAAGLQAFLVPLTYLLYPIGVGVFLRVYLSVAVRYLHGGGVGVALDLDPVATPEPVGSPDRSRRSAGNRLSYEDGTELQPAISPIDDDSVDKDEWADVPGSVDENEIHDGEGSVDKYELDDGEGSVDKYELDDGDGPGTDEDDRNPPT